MCEELLKNMKKTHTNCNVAVFLFFQKLTKKKTFFCLFFYLDNVLFFYIFHKIQINFSCLSLTNCAFFFEFGSFGRHGRFVKILSCSVTTFFVAFRCMWLNQIVMDYIEASCINEEQARNETNFFERNLN